MTRPQLSYQLAYRRPLQCVGHDLSPSGHPEDAEVIVAGLSLCYLCGQHALGMVMAGSNVYEILRGFRSGDIEVAPSAP